MPSSIIFFHNKLVFINLSEIKSNIIYKVVSIGHNKIKVASGTKRSLVDTKGQSDSYGLSLTAKRHLADP